MCRSKRRQVHELWSAVAKTLGSFPYEDSGVVRDRVQVMLIQGPRDSDYRAAIFHVARDFPD